MTSESTGIVPISNSMLVLAIHYNNIIHISCPHPLLECAILFPPSRPRRQIHKGQAREKTMTAAYAFSMSTSTHRPLPFSLSPNHPLTTPTRKPSGYISRPPPPPFFLSFLFFLGSGPFPQTTSSSPPELNAGAPDHALSNKII